MGDEVDQEMVDAFDRGLPASSPANVELRNGDTQAAIHATVLEIVISEHPTTPRLTHTYKIQDGGSFTGFIDDLRDLLAAHPEREHLCDPREHPTLSSPKKHPLLAKPRADQQPGRWIEVKLQVPGQGKGAMSSSTTTLVIRDDTVDVMGFSNHKGVWYELGNNRRMLLPPRYNNSQLLAGNWVINKEQVANLLVESCTCLGKAFAVGAVRALHCYPEPVANGDVVDPRLALLGLSVIVCDSARMNPVLNTIADGWNDGTRITEQLMTTVGKYEWMSRFLWQWSRRNYAEPRPAHSDLQEVCLVLNGPPEVVYTIGDEVSFISFMIDLRRMITERPVRRDILDEHEDRNLSSTHEHPLLPRVHAPQPERWLHVKLQVETSWTTLIMRGDNLYVHGFMNQQGQVYGLADKNKDSVTLLPDPYMGVNVKILRWSVVYSTMLRAASSDDVLKKLAGAHLGRNFAMDAVRVLSLFPTKEPDMMIGANLALVGLVIMFCESARMNPLHNAFAREWSTGSGFTKELMDLYVWQYSKKSGKLRKWKSESYQESRELPHPVKELQDVYLVLNTTSTSSGSKTKRGGDGGGSNGSGGGPNQSGEAGDNAGRSSNNGSASKPGKSGDAAGTGGGSAFQPGGAGHAGSSRGNNGSQPQDGAYDDARDDDGRPMVEILAIHVDNLVVGTKIIVYDGIRGQIIYRMVEEQRKHNEHKEQREQGMVELVLTGPYTCISAEGCFAIQIEIPDDNTGSSTRDASGPIEWEWDCYDPKYAAEVDKPPVTQLINDSVPSRKVAEVTYAVMSNAREATVQIVKFRLKDGQIAAGIGGEITAHIDGFEEKYRSVLFQCAKGTRRYFSRIDDSCWFLVELARNVVAVPCGRALHIEVNLQVETDDGKEVEVKVGLCFDNEIYSNKADDGNEVEVEVTWYPEIARSSRPPEQGTSKEGHEEECFTAPTEKNGSPEVKMVSEKYVTEVAYTIGDELSFVSFIMDLRSKLADHPYREEILDGHDLLNLSSSRKHPVLTKQRPVQPARWLHIKLQVEGKKTSWTTLLMRDDNLYIHGFINQEGVCYQLCDAQQNACTNIFPSTYSPIQLNWGVSYKSILGTGTSRDAVRILAGVHLGRNFARKAVRRLSSPHNPNDDDVPSMISARLALAGLIVMVCESARMNPLHDLFVRRWSDGTRLTEELMDRYVWRYGDMSAELLTWKSGWYAGSHPIKELQAIYLVLNTRKMGPDKRDGHRQRRRKHSNTSRDGGSSWKPGSGDSSRGGSSNAGRGGNKRKRPFKDGSSGGSQSHQRKRAYNAGSSGDPEDTSDAGRGGGRDSKSEESSDASSGGSPDRESEESSDAGSPGESDSEETSDDSGSSGGNSSGQSGAEEVDDDAQCLGRPRVELLSMRANLGVIGTKIIVYDGKRGQIIYTNEEQGEQGTMVDLVLTGPYKGISAYGCFAISIEVPAAADADSSGDPIQWEWDCYDPKCAAQVDKPPVRHTIDDVAEVTYAVMSNAREATVQVKLRLKDGPSRGAISGGTITALIDDFDVPIVLFNSSESTSIVDDHPWLTLQLSRDVLAVPCCSPLKIQVNLKIKTCNDDQIVDYSQPFEFYNNGIYQPQSQKDGYGSEVHVNVTWYPEVKSATELVHTIGDEWSFTEFIRDLRRTLADHPDREDVLDRHKSPFLSSTREHPVLAKQRAEQPARWIHVKLQALKGEEMLSTTLVMRDDNMYVCGFMNKDGDSFDLIENPGGSTDILPVAEYSSRPRRRLNWGIKYRSLLDVDTDDDLERRLKQPGILGREFAVAAVCVLSCFPGWVDERMNPRMALAGLIVMVCESARMNHIHNFIERSWSNKYRGYDNKLMRDYVFNYWRMSSELLAWKSDGYTTNQNAISLKQDLYLVLNCRLCHQGMYDIINEIGRPRVELLAIRADLGVIGTTITVFDGKQGHIIYKKKEQEEKGIVDGDLVLTGPCTSISAYGCFAIKIDIPPPQAAVGSSKGDRNGSSIKWEWDCYDPEYAKEVDRPPVPRKISSGPGRNVEVTYAVMSQAREARVQVKLWMKDGKSPCSVHGLIAASIRGFYLQSLLFRRTEKTAQHFSPVMMSTDSPQVILYQPVRSLRLARNVVAVPYGQTLDVNMHLNIETPNSHGVVSDYTAFHGTLCFKNSVSQCGQLKNGDQVEVTVAWFPYISDYSPGQSPPMTKMQLWERQPDISYKIGDDVQGFRTFISELRRMVAENPHCKDLMADHPQLSASHKYHPVLPKARGRDVEEENYVLFHIKLEVEEVTSSITLVMRHDNLDVIGFINNNGNCYEPSHPLYRQLPSVYEPEFLLWGRHRSWTEEAENTMGAAKLGKSFAEEAVHYLSGIKVSESMREDGIAKRSLMGLMIMVSDSVRMEPVREAIEGGWNKDGTTFTTQQLQNYRWMWPVISRALLDWKDHDYPEEWPKDKELESMGITSSETARKIVPVVFNDDDRISR